MEYWSPKGSLRQRIRATVPHASSETSCQRTLALRRLLIGISCVCGIYFPLYIIYLQCYTWMLEGRIVCDIDEHDIYISLLRWWVLLYIWHLDKQGCHKVFWVITLEHKDKTPSVNHFMAAFSFVVWTEFVQLATIALFHFCFWCFICMWHFPLYIIFLECFYTWMLEARLE